MNQRFHAQIELADYLAELGDLRPAHAELLVAAADAPQDSTAAAMIGRRFEQAHDLPQALKFYEKALTMNPKNSDALDGIRQVMDEMGEASEGIPQ